MYVLSLMGPCCRNSNQGFRAFAGFWRPSERKHFVTPSVQIILLLPLLFEPVMRCETVSHHRMLSPSSLLLLCLFGGEILEVSSQRPDGKDLSELHQSMRNVPFISFFFMPPKTKTGQEPRACSVKLLPSPN